MNQRCVHGLCDLIRFYPQRSGLIRIVQLLIKEDSAQTFTPRAFFHLFSLRFHRVQVTNIPQHSRETALLTRFPLGCTKTNEFLSQRDFGFQSPRDWRIVCSGLSKTSPGRAAVCRRSRRGGQRQDYFPGGALKPINNLLSVQPVLLLGHCSAPVAMEFPGKISAPILAIRLI